MEKLSSKDRKSQIVEWQKQYGLTAQECADLTGYSKDGFKKWLYEEKEQVPPQHVIDALGAALKEKYGEI